jgi:hypothetical protein
VHYLADASREEDGSGGDHLRREAQTHVRPHAASHNNPSQHNQHVNARSGRLMDAPVIEEVPSALRDLLRRLCNTRTRYKAQTISLNEAATVREFVSDAKQAHGSRSEREHRTETLDVVQEELVRMVHVKDIAQLGQNNLQTAKRSRLHADQKVLKQQPAA